MLKTIFKILALHAVAWCALAGFSLRSAQAVPDERTVQQVAALLDYVAADYGGAVKNGQVVDQTEYAEQKNLLGEAISLTKNLGAEAVSPANRAKLAQAILAVLAAVENKDQTAVVAARCQTVRTVLRDDFQLRLFPKNKSVASETKGLYQKLCAGCHGLDGRANTVDGAKMVPPPTSFFDAEKMSKVAPSLAFHILTFGVSGTAMPSFGHLSADERWALAFFVTALRHGTPGETREGPVAAQAKNYGLSLSLLSEQNDDTLCQTVQGHGLAPHLCPQALAVLRTQEPFLQNAPTALRFDAARALLAELRVAVSKKDAPTAKRLAIAAYLDGVEPLEARLRVEQPERLAEVEQAFLQLRQAVEPQNLGAEQAVFLQIAAAEDLLTRVEQNGTGQVAAFLGSLSIALREGLEVALLIGALLTFLRRSGQQHAVYLVHLGWIAAIPAGALTFWAVGALVSGAQRELAEGIMTLLSAAILITMTHWVIGAKEAQHWLGFLRRQVQGAAGRTSLPQKALLLGLSFFAVYREAVEVVLFYRSLLLSVGPGGLMQVVWGAVVGVAAMFTVVIILGKIGHRLNPRPVLLCSGVLLSGLALAMTGHGIHALQEAGVLDVAQIGSSTFQGVPALGIYPSWQVLLAQCAVALLLLAPSIVSRLRSSGENHPHDNTSAGFSKA